jgi:hypothetical protein
MANVGGPLERRGDEKSQYNDHAAEKNRGHFDQVEEMRRTFDVILQNNSISG